MNIDLTIITVHKQNKTKQKTPKLTTTSKYSQALRTRGSRPSVWAPQGASDSNSFSGDQRMKPKRKKKTEFGLSFFSVYDAPFASPSY